MIVERGKAMTIDNLVSDIPELHEDQNKSSSWKAYWVSADEMYFDQKLTRHFLSRGYLPMLDLQNAP
jgi:hypothetical protein